MAADSSPLVQFSADRDSSFDSGVQPVASSSVWVGVARLVGVRGRKITLRGTVGAGGALGHLKIMQTALENQPHINLAVDTDLNTATKTIPLILPLNAYQTAAGGIFEIEIDGSAAEYSIYAQAASTATTLQIQGDAFRKGD
jgi:hypothetical protein